LRAGIEFIKGRHDHMIVTDERNQFAGILTERDFLQVPLERGAATRTTVADLMTPASKVESAGAGDSMWECIATMKRGDYHTLPVVEEGEVRRVVSMRDICEELSLTLSKRFFMPVYDESDVTIGDLLCDVSTPGLSRSLAMDASVADAVERMRTHNHGAVHVLGGGTQIGMFSEREYLYNVLPYLGEAAPQDVPLSEVAQFSVDEVGYSQRAMQRLGSEDLRWRPSHLTCVVRSTPVRDCLSLMLPTGLLYVPVLEDEEPADVVSLRDIMLFLAQES
jgi:CBS domain-containing protein